MLNGSTKYYLLHLLNLLHFNICIFIHTTVQFSGIVVTHDHQYSGFESTAPFQWVGPLHIGSWNSQELCFGPESSPEFYCSQRFQRNWTFKNRRYLLLFSIITNIICTLCLLPIKVKLVTGETTSVRLKAKKWMLHLRSIFEERNLVPD